jgi:CBS domain-containing protein
MTICAFSTGRVCKGVQAAVDLEATVLEATRLMRRLGVDCLVVTRHSHGQPVSVGTLTAGDIVTRVTALELDPTVLTVEDITWPEPATAGPEDINDVLALLRSAQNRALAVIDGEGDIVGVLPVNDLIPTLLEELNARDGADRDRAS